MEEKERDGLESGNGRLLGIIDRNPGERERGSLSDGSTNLSFVTKTNERIRSAGEGNKEKRLLPLSLSSVGNCQTVALFRIILSLITRNTHTHRHY